LFLIGFAFFNLQQIWQHQFFLNSNYAFNYGYGVGEQRQIVNLIISQTKGKYRLHTLQPEGKFANYFANLRLLMAEKHLTDNTETGADVFIEPKSSDFPKIVNYTEASFPSVNVYFII
jgi:hypothetical protein